MDAAARPNYLKFTALSLALAGLFGPAELAAEPGAYDPLLSEPGNLLCTPAVAGRPPLLQQLVLAQAGTKSETKPFKPQAMQAASGEVPLYSDLGTLSLKVGTRDAKAQAYFD
ncbi:hypothetical protein [Paucibacter soli]|uniref:hypothetical protein n=1 Tax=Paucibacter soli TaxID=3133433 RepID=UPI0030AB39C9